MEECCPYCEGEGQIQIGNNGPIVDCPICVGVVLKQRGRRSQANDRAL